MWRKSFLQCGNGAKLKRRVFHMIGGDSERSLWASFLTWRSTRAPWRRKVCLPATRCSGLTFRVAQERQAPRPHTAPQTVPALCFSGGYIPCVALVASATWPLFFGELCPHPWRLQLARGKEKAQPRHLGQCIWRGVHSKESDLLSKSNYYHY